MATGNVAITAGSGTPIAVNTVSRDSTTENMQLVNIGDPTTGTGASVSASGALLVQNQLFSSTLTTGTITTSSSTVVESSVTGAASFSIHGTYAGVNVTFEASDDSGTTYYPVACVRNDSTAVELTSGVLAANTSRSWIVNLTGFTNFRLRATAYTSGTANVRIQAVSTSTEPNPVVTIGGTTVTQAVSLASLPALATGTNTIGKVTSTNDATTSSAQAAGVSTTASVIKSSAGRLSHVLVTTAGTANCNIYDNASAASGTIVGMITTSAVVGQVIVFSAPCASGITLGKVSGSAAFTAFYI